MAQKQNNTQTLLLYAVIFMLSFFLWKNWSTQHPPAAAKTQTPIQAANQPTHLIHTSPHRQIHLRSDVLDLTIDRQGGAIVKAELLKYNTTLKGHQPIQILSTQPNRYFVAESGLADQKPLIFSTALTPSNAQQPHATQQLTLTARTAQGVQITKTYTLYPHRYDVLLQHMIHNHSNQPWQGQFFLRLTQKKPETESLGFGQLRTYQGLAYYTEKKPYSKLPFDDLNDSHLVRTVTGGWIASQQHYFITAWIPPKHQTQQLNAERSIHDPNYYQISTTSTLKTVQPDQSYQLSHQLYIGPEHAHTLGQLAPGLELTIDYGWLWFISDGLYWLLSHIHAFVGNWGISIILLTLFIKLLFYRLSESSFKSMAKMKKLQPKIEALKSKHGDDREAMGHAMMALYKKEQVNPVGGCLPMLIQIPFFIALYWVLMESVELRHAPFFGWIQDLPTKDPYYILPIIMGITMFIQQRLGPQNADPVQARMMLALPVIFTAMFLSFPAGLVLYWLTNNLLSIAQQWYCTRKYQ